jgi:hypothetical protein
MIIVNYLAIDIIILIGVMISPPGVASVCSGDQLELTCTTVTPGTFVEWSFFLVPEGETMARRYERFIHSVSVSATSDLEVNSITFTFSRISAEGSLPLISTIVIDPVSDSLNGTEINCTDVITSNTTSTYIEVINESVVISSKSLVNYYYACYYIINIIDLGDAYMHGPIFSIINQYSS